MQYWVILPILLTSCLQAQDRGLIQIEDSRKEALVIGNSDYAKAPLKNPVNDAAAMEATLKRLGFTVTTIRNADLRRMRTAIDEFAARLGPGSFGFFYFAGHGVQVNSVNYLVPVDFSATSEDDIQYEAYPANRVQAKLEGSGARLRVLVLDACRNNPYRFKRDATEGLAAMSINAEGTLVAFATGDNNTAEENPAELNGLYTKFLIPALLSPGLNLRDAFQKAKEDVYRVSQHQQNPSIYENIVGQYALLPNGPPIRTTPADAAAGMWALIKDSENPEDFDRFVQAFPQSDLVPEAALRAAQLRRGMVKGPKTGPQLVMSAPAPAPAPGNTKVNPKDGLTYAWIPPGSFIMGCSPNDFLCKADEKPPHPVTLTKGFWMGQTPVTDMAWTRFGSETGRAKGARTMTYDDGRSRKLYETSGVEDVPAVAMTWNEARVFCEWAGGRLPTEAEWEYAGRAGNTGPKYGSPEAISMTLDNNGKRVPQNGPVRVAQKEKNAWGLYDMLGNVFQFTGDRYGANYYQQKEERDPTGAAGGESRSLRGRGISEVSLRISFRVGRDPEVASEDTGFRCILQ